MKRLIAILFLLPLFVDAQVSIPYRYHALEVIARMKLPAVSATEFDYGGAYGPKQAGSIRYESNAIQLWNGSVWLTISGVTDSTIYATKYSLDTTRSRINTALAGKQGTLSLTTTGNSGAATLVGNTLNIPQYAGGLSSGDSALIASKQAQLTGPGFVKANSGVITYDNNTYYLASNPSGYTSNTGTVTGGSGGSTGLTLTGSTTLTLGGTLAVANGGTGATTAAGARTNLGIANLADSPGFRQQYVATSGQTLFNVTAGTIPSDTSKLHVYRNGLHVFRPTYSSTSTTVTFTSGVTLNDIIVVEVDGNGFGPGGSGYVLPTASASVLGGVKVGTGLAIDGSGVLSNTVTIPSKAFQTLTDGATITWTFGSGYNAMVTLGGNRTLAISGATAGDYGTLIVTQDGTGSRTLTLPAGSKVIGGGAGAITLTTTAGAVDIISFVYNGTSYLWNYGKNYN